MIDINSLGEKKGSQPVAGYRGDWLSEDLLSSMPIFLSLNKVFYFRFHFCEFSVPALHCKYKIYIENVFRQYILVQG